ncbi:hypothetical protein ACT3CD_08115 [Geofilum sp. OHC36d9]|uniref:hypothetical protein n=1 Tax=Geofilum sp. OHC36d9 TaxID=3458413 RepID=UPI00403447BA
MYQPKKHIIVLLLWIFLSPQVYQAWHIVAHHSNLLQKKECLDGCHHDTTAKNKGLQWQEKKSLCPILTFHFYHITGPADETISFKPILVTSFFKIRGISNYHRLYNGSASSRAPPAA